MEHVEALIAPARHGRRKWSVNVREAANRILHLVSNGWQK